MYSSSRRRLAMRKPTPSSRSVRVSSACASTYRSYFFDRRQLRIEAVAAASFVKTARADEHAVAARDEALRVIRRLTAHDADRVCLGDVFGDRQQVWHRLERPAEVIL